MTRQPTQSGHSRSPDLGARIRRAVRDVPDFPTAGVVFKDITPLLADAHLFGETARAMSAPFREPGVTHVGAIESRGFIFGAVVARELGVGLVPIRKPGKLPCERRRVEYALEYGSDALEIHSDACGTTARVLVVDDVLATGGTAAAAAALIATLGAAVVGFSFLLEISTLGGRERLSGVVRAVVAC